MDERRVKDLMVPLERYALVSEDDTLLDAIKVLKVAQQQRNRRHQPFRAVLIVDKNKKVIGKLSELAFLKTLEPKRRAMDEACDIAKAGVSEQVQTSVLNSYQLFEDNFSHLCNQARTIKVKDAARPFLGSIDEETLITEAILKMLMWDTLSVLVTRKNETVGLLRTSDICQEVAEQMKAIAQ